MSLNIGDNFSYLGKKFLDNRQSFDTLELMNNCSDVPIGFITFCKEDNKRYEYTESGWVEYSTSISSEQVEKINAAYIHSQTQHVQPSDLEGFATEEFVTNKIAEAELGGEEVDLSGYVSKEELEGKGYLTGIPEEYVTDEELNAKGYLTEHQDLSGYVSKEELEGKGYLTGIPEEYVTDEELNAKGYLTEHQDLSGYVSKEELEGKGYLTGIPEEYVTDEELNTKGYLTEHQDLSGYISKEELESKGYLTGIPEEYVTDEELNSKGYLTEHQDLSNYATKEYVDEAVSNIDISGGGNADIDLSDYVTNDKLQEGLANKFDNVEVNEAETNDDQTALDFYANGEVVKTVYFSGGGGGSATIPPYISTILPENSILGLGGVFNLQLDFSSSVTGRGTVKIFVNDVESISMSIPQGENTIPMADTYFTKGNNRVTVYVIDRTGQMSNSLTFYVRYGSLEIVSDFDAYTAYEPGAVVRYYFTPTAVDTSLALTMYMKIDGEVKDGVSCSSDTRGYFTFPNNLEVGAHFCQAYVTDSAGNTSNVLSFNFIVLDAVSLVVASDTVNPIVEEGEQLSLDYKVYMRGATSFITKTYIDENLVNTGTCGLDFAYYRTSTLTEGIHTIKMEVYDVTETVSDYIIWTVTVTPSTYEMLQPVKAGSLFIGTAQNMTNSSENKEVWRGIDQDGAIVDGILHNFAFNSESGWVDDELLISGASSVEIPITPLANNARYGFTLDIEFASKMIGVDDALVLNLWDDEKDCGIKITTEQVILRSAEGNQANLYFTDSEMTSVMFVIDRNEATAKIYLNGVMCSAFHLSDYSIDGVPYLEDFTVNNTIMLGGSGHARIKNLRVYQVALSTDEILNNFMANETRKAEQKALVEFQKGDHLPTLTIYCDFSGLGKDDKKPCAITYVSTDEEKYGKSFTLTHKKSTCQYQGTSSMAYPIKNYRINLADENGEKWKYDFPYGKPERRFTLKADFMSSGHWTNTGLTKWINNNLYNYDLDDEKTMNPKKWYDINHGGSIDDTRECIYGFPCRLILVNDGNTPLNEGQNEPTPGNTKDMGIFNFNHDKDATDTMGFDDDVFPYCASYEVTANSDTSAGAFMSYETVNPSDMSELDYIKQSFELRFPDEDDVPESWGFMGIPKIEEKITITVPRWGRNDSYVCGIPTEYFGTSLTNNSGLRLTYFRFHDANGEQISEITLGPGSTISIPENATTFTFYEETKINSYAFNEHVVIAEGVGTNEEWSGLAYSGHQTKTTTINSGYVEGTGLKALIDWVDGCTDEEFVRDFDQHFNRDYTLRYFLLVITLGMVDNLGKNMMLDTWDNKIFMPRFYDCDTICSYDNSGQLKFDVDIEMAQGYWNTSSSRLWTRIRDLMHDELVAKYNNMRQNGMSYESFMECFYDEQIAKIPQKYYNMDYDVKYGPFADSYIGMANGDTYEHVKRWLQQRLRFVDTLYDYAPSYNNDVLTIRANTTEPMTLEIETYTPVYQHLSWYNNQMDKKKIDGKTSVSFTGTAMAATDQEVLIYGGSNIKSIKGISSMNPNRMLIGSATRLIELDAPNCPLLADINANKANLAPHLYLNKVNLNGCPLLGGNLIVNQSPLVREIDIRGTAITGLNLPPSLRNLEILRLPAAIQNLVLNDAGQLHTLEFEDGGTLQSVSMTNCNALTNVTNFDLEDATSITLNNSYNTVDELYFSKATNLSLSNMASLERVVYTPNAEHEVFDKTNVDNASNYTISTFNCPKLNTFMTTAPYRESYNAPNLNISLNNGYFLSYYTGEYLPLTDGIYATETFIPISPGNNTLYYSGSFKSFQIILYDENKKYTEKLNETYFTNITKVPFVFNVSEKYKYFRLAVNCEGMPAPNTNDIKINEAALSEFKDYGKKKPNEVFEANVLDISSTQFKNVKLLCTTDTNKLLLPRTVKNLVVDSAYDLDTCYLTDGDYDTVHGELIEPYTTDYVDPIRISSDEIEYIYIDKNTEGSVQYKTIRDDGVLVDSADQSRSAYVNYLPVSGGTTITIGYVDIWTPDTFEYDKNKNFIKKTSSKGNILLDSKTCYLRFNTVRMHFNNYKLTLGLQSVKTPNIVPSASDGSLIFSMYAPHNTTEPASGVWDLKGFEFDTFHTFGLNNDIVQAEDGSITMPNRLDGYTNRVDNFVSPYEVARYIASDTTTMPSFNSEFRYHTFVSSTDNGYEYAITADDLDNLPTQMVFKSLTGLRSVKYLKTDSLTSMSSMFYNCSKLESINLSNSNTTNVKNMTSMFQGCPSLSDVNLSGVNTSNVTNFFRMFYGCSSLTSLDLSSFDADKVIDIEEMFCACSKLEDLILFGGHPKLYRMRGVFHKCNKLKSLDLNNWDTRDVNSTENLFQSCSSLTSLEGLENWDTLNVTNMNAMFQNCHNLANLDLSSFDTSNVTGMRNTFLNCYSLISLDSMMNIPISLDLSVTILDQTSLVDVINNLATVTTEQTLTLGATLLAKLTEEQIAVAINKGWTLA